MLHIYFAKRQSTASFFRQLFVITKKEVGAISEYPLTYLHIAFLSFTKTKDNLRSPAFELDKAQKFAVSFDFVCVRPDAVSQHEVFFDRESCFLIFYHLP